MSLHQLLALGIRKMSKLTCQVAHRSRRSAQYAGSESLILYAVFVMPVLPFDGHTTPKCNQYTSMAASACFTVNIALIRSNPASEQALSGLALDLS